MINTFLVNLIRQIVMPLPNSSNLWGGVNSLSGKDCGEVLGGNLKGLTNFCAIRLSYALIQCGQPITRASDYKDKHGNKYIIRTQTMEEYLNQNYQPSQAIQTIQGLSGIVYFKECGFNDATGHVDVVLNGKCADHDFSTKAKSIRIWKC